MSKAKTTNKAPNKGGTKSKAPGAGRSSTGKKKVPKEKGLKVENEEAGTISGALLSEAEEHEIENGTAGHEMEISADESETEE